MPRLRDEDEKRTAIRRLLASGRTYPQIMAQLGVSRGFIASTRRMTDDTAAAGDEEHVHDTGRVGAAVQEAPQRASAASAASPRPIAAPASRDAPKPAQRAPGAPRGPAPVEWCCDENDCETHGVGPARVCMGCGVMLAKPLNPRGVAVSTIVSLWGPAGADSDVQVCDDCGQRFVGWGCYCPTCGRPDPALAEVDSTDDEDAESVEQVAAPARAPPAAPPTPSEPPVYTDDTCSNCKTHFWGHAKVCPGCGYSFREPDERGAIVSTGDMPLSERSEWQCSDCGQRFNGGANYCPGCGRNYQGVFFSANVPALDVSWSLKR